MGIIFNSLWYIFLYEHSLYSINIIVCGECVDTKYWVTFHITECAPFFHSPNKHTSNGSRMTLQKDFPLITCHHSGIKVPMVGKSIEFAEFVCQNVLWNSMKMQINGVFGSKTLFPNWIYVGRLFLWANSYGGNDKSVLS